MPPLDFGPDGLVPAVVQDVTTREVLMVAFMNEAALAATRATGRTHFWSRRRGMLWRKGETSGHEQIVEAIYVNCERNSLLVTVRQLGAACHDGYPSCYYRRLESDGTLTVVRERAFDPAAVYAEKAPSAQAVPAPSRSAADPAACDLEGATHTTVVDDCLKAKSRLLYDAYAYLRDHDLSTVSATSACLRNAGTDDTVRLRLADELRELAGVLDGTHRHAEPAGDIVLEGTQVFYWTVLVALRGSVTWEALRPDRALATDDAGFASEVAAKLLRAEAEHWGASPAGDLAARCHATLALLAQGCRVAGVPVGVLLEADLAALRSKAYLAPFFAGATGDGERAPGGQADTGPAVPSRPATP